MKLWKKTAPDGFDTLAACRTYVEETKPDCPVGLYAKGSVGIKSSLLGCFVWTWVDPSDHSLGGFFQLAGDLLLDRATGDEFVLGAGGDIYTRSGGGTLSWVDGKGPKVEDEDLVLDIGVETDQLFPSRISVNALVDFTLTADVPVDADGALAGWLNPSDKATLGGCIYNGTAAAWRQGIRVEGGLATIANTAAAGLTYTDAVLTAYVTPSANSAVGYIYGHHEAIGENSAPPAAWGGASLLNDTIEPQGQAVIRAISSGGSGAAEVTVKRLSFHWTR